MVVVMERLVMEMVVMLSILGARATQQRVAEEQLKSQGDKNTLSIGALVTLPQAYSVWQVLQGTIHNGKPQMVVTMEEVTAVIG
ncbi:hypothetical protein BKA69DRAFT_1088706 [Paraphysoderma sedebokerense]|nr:hypothetical protein BKA69DRAFT_1088706 [Paraphysoderma sedebokerense]